MRARKKKHGAERLAACDEFFVHDPESHKGNWRNIFAGGGEIRLEIGCGKGRFILESAKKFPNVNFIGIEKVPDIIMLAGEKLKKENITNVKLIMADAEALSNYFEKGEISRIYLNFSDPWKKSRQAKRRLTYHTFLESYRKVLPEGGIVEFKTDNRPLFDFSLEEMQNYGWELSDVCFDLHNSEYEKDNIHTEYEDNFSGKGFTINRLVGKAPLFYVAPPEKKKAAESGGTDSQDTSVKE